MARYARNMVMLAKVETTYGTDSTPTAGANSILVSNVTINPLVAQNVSRDLIRSYMGASESLVGSGYVDLQFSVELQSSGTAGTAPAWDALVRACGMTATTGTTPGRVDYTPLSASFESNSIYLYDDTLKHTIIGARGSFDVSMSVSQRPVLNFKMMGIYSSVSSAANPTGTYTAWKTPLVVTDTNTADLIIGGTYTTGTITGGTTYVSAGLEASFGGSAQFIPLVGQESVDITGRETTGKLILDLTAAQEATFSTNVRANTLSSVGIIHGTAAGSQVLVYGPAVQFLNWRKEDRNGRRLIGYDLRFTPSTGNDEFRIVAL
jgi:hypothetical protein